MLIQNGLDLDGAKGFSSIVDLLEHRAAEQSRDRAYVFLSERGVETDVLTFGDVCHRAYALAYRLMESGQRGDRALLLFPPGVDFFVAFFGCLLAGVIAVPLMPPRRASSQDASASIVADCAPRFTITSAGLAATRPDLMERFRHAGIDWMALEQTYEMPARRDIALSAPRRDDLAFLQYTSGSTSVPKGVMVSHGNLLANLEMIRRSFGTTRNSTHVNWIPVYHDMGLIIGSLGALYVGACCVLLVPTTFLQRPAIWLRAIHDYCAEVTCAPNFAFDLCVSRIKEEQISGLDLSHLKIALNGAEPVRADTIERFVSRFAHYGFRAEAMYPAYGLAEATVLVSGRQRGGRTATRKVSRSALQNHRVAPPTDADDAQVLVSCGRATAGERITIVDPESCRQLATEVIGEIWVSGPNVAQGYWHNSDATSRTFDALVAGGSAEHWLRTGDYGFLDAGGELYITGRIKDLIIIRGMNHYPQDIEYTVQKSHPMLRPSRGVAFGVTNSGEEKLVIVQEVDRAHRRELESEQIVGAIREAIVNEHEITPHAIVLIPPGVLPLTTSGKVQRNLTRQRWLQGDFDKSQTGKPQITL